jgi:hypothetical protein
MAMLCSSVLFVFVKAKSSYIDQLPFPIGVLSRGGISDPWRPPLPPFSPENRTPSTSLSYSRKSNPAKSIVKSEPMAGVLNRGPLCRIEGGPL